MQADAEFLLGGIVKTVFRQQQGAVEVDFGSGDARVFHAGRTAVVMPLNVSDFTNRTGYSKPGAIIGIVIVGLAEVHIVAFCCDSVRLRLTKAEFQCNIIGAEVFIRTATRVDASGVGALIPCELGHLLA